MRDLSDAPRRACYREELAVGMYLRQEGERVGFVLCFPASENETRLAMDI